MKYTKFMADAKQNNNLSENDQPRNMSCPYLGLESDPTTWLSYANSGNFCHRLSTPKPVDVRHQRQFCLTQAHPICKIYAQDTPAPLPSVSSVEQRSKNHQLRLIAWVLILLVTITGLLILTFWLYANWEDFTNRLFSAQPAISNLTATAQEPFPTKIPTQTPTSFIGLASEFLPPIATATPTASATPTLEPTPTLSSTPQPSLTPTQPTPGPALNTPFGPGNQFLLHRVATGESLGNLAIIYRTSTDVIRAANVLIEGASVWPDTVLVIYPDVIDPSQVTRFRVIQLKDPAYPEDIATQHQVPLEALLEYNQLDPQVLIPAGRWLVLPVSS